MSLSMFLPMSAFALAASISPGPVNLVCLSSGTRYPLRDQPSPGGATRCQLRLQPFNFYVRVVGLKPVAK